MAHAGSILHLAQRGRSAQRRLGRGSWNPSDIPEAVRDTKNAPAAYPPPRQPAPPRPQGRATRRMLFFHPKGPSSAAGDGFFAAVDRSNAADDTSQTALDVSNAADDWSNGANDRSSAAEILSNAADDTSGASDDTSNAANDTSSAAEILSNAADDTPSPP